MKDQEAFLDIRVFDPNANRYLNATLLRCQKINKKVKKQNYNKTILQTEHGTFTPLVFSLYGSMGKFHANFKKIFVQNFIQNLQNCHLINFKK